MKQQTEKIFENQKVWSALKKTKYTLNGIFFSLLAAITVEGSIIGILIDDGYQMNTLEMVLAVACGVVLIAGAFLSKMCMDWLDQCAGYYCCKKCGHIHAPTEKDLSDSLQFFRYRLLKCPDCKEGLWQRKVPFKATKNIRVEMGEAKHRKQMTAVRKPLWGNNRAIH